MYLDYTEYQNMGGALDETTFNEYEFDAETLVNYYTFNRLKKETTYPEELPRLMYELIKYIQLRDDALNNNITDSEGNVKAGGITKQSNDGVTTQFNLISSAYITEYASDKRMGLIISKYLNGVKDSLGRKLLYRGLYPGE